MLKNKYSFNNALVIINRLSKAIWIILYKDFVMVKIVTLLYYKGPFYIYSLLKEIVINRGL